jgi:hypothetical protein
MENPPVNALWTRVINYWRRNARLRIRPGASELAIHAFEHEHQVHMPRDFSDYLCAVDGMDDTDSDNELMSFLPLAQIRPVHEAIGEALPDNSADHSVPPRCFVFIDYLIGSHFYAIAMGDDADLPGVVYRVLDANWHKDIVASSFRDFMARYAQDPASVF